MKITVKSTNRDLIFFPDTKIRVQENNPMFHELGSYSFPFDIPLEENNRALEYPARLTRAQLSQLSYEVLIESKAIPFDSGLLLINSTQDKISASLIIGQGLLYNKLKNTKLRDVINETISFDDQDDLFSHINNTTNNSWPNVPYNFPVISTDNFYGGNNDTFLDRINFFAPNFSDTYAPAPFYRDTLPNVGFQWSLILYPDTPSQDVFFYDNFTTIIPFLYVSEILKRIFDYFELDYDNKIINHPGIKRLMLWNNHTLDLPYLPVVIANTTSPLTINAANNGDPAIFFNINLNDIATDEFDIWDGNKLRPKHPGAFKFIFDLNYTANTPIISYLFRAYVSGTVQDPYILEMSDGASSHTITINYSLSDFNNNRYIHFKVATDVFPSGVEDIVTNPNTLTVSMRAHLQRATTRFVPEINLSNHVPDISVSDFINSFKNMLGFDIFEQRSYDNPNALFLNDIATRHPNINLSKYVLNKLEINNPLRISSLAFDNADTVNIDPYNLSQTVNNKESIATEYIDNQLIFVKNLNKYLITKYNETYHTFLTTLTENLFPKNFIIEENTTNAKSITANYKPATTINDWVTRDIDFLNESEHVPLYLYIELFGPDDFARDGIMPFISDKANSPLYKIQNDFSNIIFNWLGKINFSHHQSGWDPYPAASSSNRDNQGNLVSGALQLSWDALYAEFWADFIQYFNNTQSVKQDYDLPITVLSKLDFSKKYMENGVEFLISQIDFEFDITTDEIKQPVTLTLAVKK